MNAWLHLRDLLAVVSSDPELSSLDDRTQRVLEWVAVNHPDRHPIYVQTIVSECGVASPATVHKALGVLERSGHLEMEVDVIDSRRRIVSPTPKARRLLAKLDRFVSEWATTLKR
jgi:DNA-binding MarR family transcriptional regulator